MADPTTHTDSYGHTWTTRPGEPWRSGFWSISDGDDGATVTSPTGTKTECGDLEAAFEYVASRIKEVNGMLPGQPAAAPDPEPVDLLSALGVEGMPAAVGLAAIGAIYTRHPAVQHALMAAVDEETAELEYNALIPLSEQTGWADAEVQRRAELFEQQRLAGARRFAGTPRAAALRSVVHDRAAGNA